MRKGAKNEFVKDYFKLMNNRVFGKKMEILRKRVNIQLVIQKKPLLKLSSKPGFKFFKIFIEDQASVILIKGTLVLNRSIYVRFSILELLKVLMYDFHYQKKVRCLQSHYVMTYLTKMCVSTCWKICTTLTLVITQMHIFFIAMKTRKC